METKQLTAVEWLFIWCNSNPNPTDVEFSKAFNEAKEMQKEQIIDAFNYGQIDLGLEADEYYNQTYNN